jgi:hypothetical protein
MNDLHVVARRAFFPTKQSPRLNGGRHVHKACPELACPTCACGKVQADLGGLRKPPITCGMLVLDVCVICVSSL